MSKNKMLNPADFIVPLNMNGLQGRLLHLPAPPNTKREILFVYGHHSSLERWWGVVQDLNQYGAVSMPDLPGFGGMESFYKIDQQPTIDALADYLAAFVKMRYSRRQVTIAGLSFGFVIATRMLQRYPDLVKKVDLLISVVGFAHHDDFVFTKPRYLSYKSASWFFSHKTPSMFFRNIALHPLVIKTVYEHTHNAKQKFAKLNKDQKKEIMNFEVYLWRANDIRTHMKTSYEFLKLDNCKKQIDLPVWHISVKGDRYFDNNIVEQHMRIIFTDFSSAKSKMDSHAPSIIADVKTGAPLIPTKIRRLLAHA